MTDLDKKPEESTPGTSLDVATLAQPATEVAGAPTPGASWAEKFKGTPFAIAVPPYIRFLQGIVILHRALAFLATTKAMRLKGEGQAALGELIECFESSKEAKELGLSFETYFASQLTINLISEVEHYFANVLTAVLRMHPAKMGSLTFKLTEILSAGSTDELVERAAEQYLNKLMYEKPQEYLKCFAATLSIDPACLALRWPGFVEAKARRDLGVHNNWVANEIYLRKTREANFHSLVAVGERVIPDFEYVTRTAKLCYELVDDITNAVADKWLPALPSEKD